MAMQIPSWTKPAIWGAVGGAVVFAIIGFSTDWLVTSSTAQETAELKADKAVVAALTPICIAQFRKSPTAERTTHFAALEKEAYWERGNYVEEQGWATMPGMKQANDEVAEACATELLKISAKSENKPAGAS